MGIYFALQIYLIAMFGAAFSYNAKPSDFDKSCLPKGSRQDKAIQYIVLPGLIVACYLARSNVAGIRMKPTTEKLEGEVKWLYCFLSGHRWLAHFEDRWDGRVKTGKCWNCGITKEQYYLGNYE